MAITFGTANEYLSSDGAKFSSVVALSSTVAVVMYDDNSSSNDITARVCTISGLDVTFGTAVVAKAADTSHLDTVKVTSTTFMVVGAGWSRIGTVAGADVTFGVVNVFDTDGNTTFNRLDLLSSGKVIRTWRDIISTGKAVVSTVSGTDITDGAFSDWVAAGGGSFHDMSVLDSTHFVVCYRDINDSSHGTAKIGTVSGTDITFGAEHEFLSGTATSISVVAMSPTSFVVMYADGSDLNHGTVKIGTVSGTAITFGAEHEFLSSNGSGNIFSQYITKLDSDRVLVIYRDTSDANHGTSKIGTVSGTDVTFDSEAEFLSANGAEQFGFGLLTDDAGLIAYTDESDSNHGTARVAVGLGAGLLNIVQPNKNANMSLALTGGKQ